MRSLPSDNAHCEADPTADWAPGDKVITWRIYYGDKSTFSGGEPTVAPALNVQVILQYDPVAGWYLQSGADYYVYRDDDNLWQGVDNMGLWDYLQTDGWKRVLFGRTIRSEDYAAIFQAAIRARNALKAG